MTALYYLIVVPPMIVLCGAFWGLIAIVGVSALESLHYRRKAEKKLRAHRVRA